jgi:hypothetical protein
MLAHLLYSDAFEEALNVALLSVQSPPSKTQARESGGDDDSSSGEEDDAPSGQGPLPTASSTNHTDEVSTKGHASTSSGHPSSSDRDTSNASSSGRPAGALLKKVIWVWRFATRALVLLLPLTVLHNQWCVLVDEEGSVLRSSVISRSASSQGRGCSSGHAGTKRSRVVDAAMSHNSTRDQLTLDVLSKAVSSASTNSWHPKKTEAWSFYLPQWKMQAARLSHGHGSWVPIQAAIDSMCPQGGGIREVGLAIGIERPDHTPAEGDCSPGASANSFATFFACGPPLES